VRSCNVVRSFYAAAGHTAGEGPLRCDPEVCHWRVLKLSGLVAVCTSLHPLVCFMGVLVCSWFSSLLAVCLSSRHL
jgi:hypothetical protein